ncbi:trichohyalin-like isoform X2 [Eurosta solidaginis]|uniref:trichohyalin-like isoform X2 n=1 Tax=Eurosta solidaginis TaxID=178769 RepID=UPI003530B7A4
MSDFGQPLTKRKRQHPNKKWTDRDVLQIIDFLQEEEEIEQPTAQIYYRRFLEKSQLDATWELVRWKVRHLKTLFNKANEWLLQQQQDLCLISADAELANEHGILIKDKLARMCPHFERLKSIFGQQFQTYQEAKKEVFIIDETQDTLASDVQASDPPPSDIQESDTPTSDPLFTIKEHSIATPRVTFDTQKSSRPINQQTAIQRERLHLDHHKFEREKEIEQRRLAIEEKKLEIDLHKAEYEKKKYEKDRQLEERKIVIEEKRLELDLRKVELDAKIRESELELKKQELEMRERIAKYEIDQKYKDK